MPPNKDPSFYLAITDGIKNGSYPSAIADDMGMSRQEMNKYVRQLKKARVISKIGYGVWSVNNDALQVFLKDALRKNNIRRVRHDNKDQPEGKTRGHGWQFTLHFPNVFSKHFRRKLLDAHKIQWTEINNPTWKGESFELGKWRVWFTPKGLTAYFSKSESIYSDTAADAWLEAAYLFSEEVIKKIERMSRKNLKSGEKGYKIKTSAEHYALIKNSDAKAMRDDKYKLYVYCDETGQLWLLADFSHQEDELECVQPGKAVQHTDDVISPFYNSLKRRPITTDFIIDGFAAMQEQMIHEREQRAEMYENQKLFGDHMKSHVAVVANMAVGAEALGKSIVELTKVVKQLKGSRSQTKKRVPVQSGLGSWIK